DLNAAQYELVRLLAETATVFAIGDPDQAIYGFRGSRPAWFYRFVSEQKPEFHHLATNYRSGSDILRAAGAVIAANHQKDAQEGATKAASEYPGALFRYLAPTAKAEAGFIAGQIQQLIGGTSHREIDRITGSQGSEGGLALSDIAILYRTARQADAIAQALAQRTIPCQVVDIQPFYQSGETKCLYYWIMLAAERIDAAELLFLLAQEKGIGAKALAVAESVLSEDKEQHQGCPLTVLAAATADLPKNLQKRVHAFAEFVDRLTGQSSVAEAVDLLCEEYNLNLDAADVVRFREMAASSPSLSAFAEHLRQHQDNLIYDDRAESVLLATLHAAKGLEFRAVFMVGCEEGLLPLTPRSELSKKAEQEHIQEERRLFFVGMTRAAEVLYLTGAKERQGFAGIEQRSTSPFLNEIPLKLLHDPPLLHKTKKKKRVGNQLKLF
ncbi:MAG: ATP-dependent helicase, partial [Candidatus Electrothrix sp. ATG2]|nr:ATP-dependent helicase [Candidatus Electrothrix sp. ATG2]